MDYELPGETSISRLLVPVGRAFGMVELFIRFKALGFTLVMPLLGAATISPRLESVQVVVLMAVALCFHLFAYILNDVIDLPVDRTEALRSEYPLVKGTIRPPHALIFALAQVPLAAALTATVGGNSQAYAAVGAGFALMAVYNLWGKRTIFPPLTDAVQGLAWGALVLYGAAIRGSGFTYLTVMAVAFVAVFIILINGVHGSLRDLENDLRCGLRTTAILLGAKPRPGGVYIPRALALYTLVLQAILTGLLFLPLDYNWFGYLPGELAIGVACQMAVAGVSVVLLAVGARSGGRAQTLFVCGSLHLVITFGSLILLFGLYLDPALLAIVLTSYFGPLLTSSLLHAGLVRAWGKLRRGAV